MALAVILLLVASLGTAAPAVATGTGAVYTTSADFALGTEVGVNHTAVADQLQLNETASTFPFIWVANSDAGTVSKLDTVTGAELGRYLSAPNGIGRNPSRTTVDQNGNMWVGNRDSNTITKIALAEAGNCVDRNGNGVIETSTGAADIKAWPAGGPPADECILMNVALGTAAWDNNNVRAVAIDANNNVFAGMSSGNNIYHVNGATGAIIQTFTQPFSGNYASYGAVVDGAGNLWVSGDGNNKVAKHTFNPDGSHAAAQTINLPGWSYGMAIAGDYIWVSGWTFNNINKIRLSDGVKVATYNPPGANGLRGVAVTDDGDIWVASSYGNNVIRLHPDGSHVATIGVGSHPTGVAVDAAGKVWVTNYWSSNVSRINPATNTVDATFPVGAGPYNYSDMTGIVSRNVTTTQGTWTVVHDSGVAGTAWGTATWHSTEPAGTGIAVRVRAAETIAGLGSASWVMAPNGTAFAGATGRYVQMEVKLSTTVQGVTPTLQDISIAQAAATQPDGTYFVPPLDVPGNPLPGTIQFERIVGGNNVLDTSVAVRIRNAATNVLIAGYTYGATITYDPVTGVYSLPFNPATYGLASGTTLKIMVYFGGKLTTQTTAIVP